MIRTARDVVADIGKDLAARSGGLVDLSLRNPRNGERDCHVLMSKYCRLAMPLRKDWLDLKDDGPNIPFLRLRDWMHMMMEHNCLHILSGLIRPHAQREEAIWKQFWKNWERHEPGHPIYQRARDGEVDLGRCFAILLHGDEGRSKKRLPFLILNIHSILGRGVQVGLDHAPKKRYIKMKPNFDGHSYTSRFMVCAMPKSAYTGDNSDAFDIMLDAIADELCHVSNHGVTDRFGTKYWAFCVGIVGDWPWLAKAGYMTRSFMNAPKHRSNPDAGAAQPSCRGICHLCKGGQAGWPFEEIGTRSPTWMGSVLVQSPFGRPNPFRNLPHSAGNNQLATLYRFDLFHTWHLGLAKNYLGSALALLSKLQEGTNVDTRFQNLTIKYLEFCKAHHLPAHIQKISKESINWISTTSYPTGSWHKGALSTSLMRFVEDQYRHNDWSGDELLELTGQACVAANMFLGILYRSDAWLEPSAATQAAGFGFRFLRRYLQCALISYQRGDRLFIIQPKAHAFHHLCVDLAEGARRGPTLNTICTSVQMDEDFIGRGSRLSRHVNEKHVAERVVNRYLQACYAQWVECGYFIRAEGK